MFSNFILSLLSLVSPNGQFAVQLEDWAAAQSSQPDNKLNLL